MSRHVVVNEQRNQDIDGLRSLYSTQRQDNHLSISPKACITCDIHESLELTVAGHYLKRVSDCPAVFR